ncbi:MAG: ComF family protein [Flavobacteriales bacterium]
MIKAFVDSVVQFFFPTYCLACQQVIDHRQALFCFSCYSDLPRTRYFSEPYNLLYRRFVDDGLELQFAATLFYFRKQSVLQKAIHQLKYNHKSKIGIYFGRLLGLEANNIKCLVDANYLLPMPLHPKKKNERGYNQSYYIAKGISGMTSIAIENKAVRRIKNTSSQTKMNKKERLENMKGAFEWTKSFPDFTHFVVVDDVITTRASLTALINSCPNKTYRFSVLGIGKSD